MEEFRQKGAILPEEKYIKRPTMIEGIRKASLLNKTGIRRSRKAYSRWYVDTGNR